MHLSNELPLGWKWVKLGEIAEKPQYGYTESASSVQVGPKFLRITDMTSGEIDWEAVPYCKCDARTLEKYKLQPGDILFARSGSIGATILIKEVPEEAIFASYLIRVRLHKNILPEFVSMALKSPICQSQLVPQGATQKNINAKLIENLWLPLPSLSEQKRIVARINDLFSRIREAKRLRQEAQQEAERLWQSVLADTFPKPGTKLPEGWKWVKMGEVAYRESKTIKPAEEPTKIFRYLGMEHVDAGQWEEPLYVEVEGAMIKSQALVFYPGMVLYGKLRPYLNKVVIPTAEGVASTEFVPILPHNNILIPEYLGAYLRSPYFVSYANRNTAGSRQPRLQLEALWGALIPLAPLPDQKRILMYLESLQKKIKTLRQSQFQVNTEIELLENSILEKAFRGDL